jgi:hypothetical protein
LLIGQWETLIRLEKLIMKIPQLATGKFPIPRLNWLLFAFFLRQNHALHWKIAIHSNYSKS